jgi:heat-inducible transcriptional repressor
MSDALSARQTQVLKALIDEYIETAIPVGSEALEKKYNLGVSPATIRNEMLSLTKYGYLRQPHTSAGRVPSPKGMKFYIDQLMEERQLSLVDEVKAREDISHTGNTLEQMLDEAAHALSHTTKCLAVATLDTGTKVWHCGYAHIFASPEFADFQTTSSLFAFLEEVKMMQELFFSRMTGRTPVEVLFGEELGWRGFQPIGIVGTRFAIGKYTVGLGVIGPIRLEYSRVIPAIRFMRSVIEEATMR